MYKYITPDMQEWDIDYTYEPAEADGSDTPGSPAMVTINSVTEEGVLVPLDSLSRGVLAELERAILMEYAEVKTGRPRPRCVPVDWSPATAPCGSIYKR